MQGFNFISGIKIDKTMVSSGADYARVDGVFVAPEEPERGDSHEEGKRLAIQKFDEALREIATLGIDVSEGTVVLTRVVKYDGKSEARINGEFVTLAVLKAVAQKLINMHGQHDTAELLDSKNYIKILDSFGGAELAKIYKEYTEEYEELQNLKKKLTKFGGSEEERERTIDLLSFQIREIEEANIQLGEDIFLQEKKSMMQSNEKVIAGISKAIAYEPGDAIGKFAQALSSISAICPVTASFMERAISFQHEVDSLASELQSHSENLLLDENEIDRIDERLDTIKSLKRKYGATLEDISQFLFDARAEHERLVGAKDSLETLKSEIERQIERVLAKGLELHKAREYTARRLEVTMHKELFDLGMEKAILEIKVMAVEPSGDGCDSVEFMFTANKGQPLRPLSKNISGGEMSRFMLSLKAIGAGSDFAKTLVLDEIDTGIGGMIAGNIAQKIVSISKYTQVIVVTHLAQIAKMADAHFLIKKIEQEDRTITTIRPLDKAEKNVEYLRMIGSINSPGKEERMGEDEDILS